MYVYRAESAEQNDTETKQNKTKKKFETNY